MIKRDIDNRVRMFNEEIRNNMFNEGLEERVSDGGERIEEASKTAFNRREIN